MKDIATLHHTEMTRVTNELDTYRSKLSAEKDKVTATSTELEKVKRNYDNLEQRHRTRHPDITCLTAALISLPPHPAALCLCSLCLPVRLAHILRSQASTVKNVKQAVFMACQAGDEAPPETAAQTALTTLAQTLASLGMTEDQNEEED